MPLKNYGGKGGKEGWLFVRQISEPRELVLKTGEFSPLGLVVPPLRPTSGRFYNVYGHYWDETYQWINGERGGVTGFTNFGAWWGVERVRGNYWAGTNIPHCGKRARCLSIRRERTLLARRAFMMNAWDVFFFIHDQEAGTVVKGQPLENHVRKLPQIIRAFPARIFPRKHERSLVAGC
jgi:hypothetical protein